MHIPKLVVTDLDGTALRNDKTVSENTSKAFAQCHSMGIPIAIATARYLEGAAPYAKALHAEYQILTDGTLVFQNDQLIYHNCLDVPTTNQILTELKRRDCTDHIAIPTVQGLYRYPRNTEPISIVNNFFEIEKEFPLEAAKLAVEINAPEIADDIATMCHCTQFHYRGENLYTFFHPTASKLDAIRHLAGRLQINLEDILVFGDDINDMEMIESCGMGVAMENALPEVKHVANYITKSNEQDGVADFLSYFVKLE